MVINDHNQSSQMFNEPPLSSSCDLISVMFRMTINPSPIGDKSKQFV